MKKLLTIALAALLILGTVPTGFAEDTGSASLALTKEPVELSVLLRGSPPYNDQGTKWFLEFCEKELNVKLNAEFVDPAAFNEKLGMLIGSNDMPDMIMASSTVRETQVMEWGYMDELLLAIDEYEEYCPNYWQEIRKQPELVAATTTPDGHTYGFSTIRVVHEGQSMGTPTIINRQWLENLGLEMPDTLDDFYNVLCAFRDQDANGNGDPTDEIPWAGVNSEGYPEFMVVKWAFGINGYRFDAVDSATLEGYWAPYHPRYKEALAFMKKLYDENLLYSGYFSASRSHLLADVQSSPDPIVGFSIDEGRGTATSSSEHWSQYDACPPFVADDTIVRNTWKSTPIDLFTWIINAETDYPELCCSFCDFWYDPYWAICYQQGPEYGTEYDYWGTGWVWDGESQTFNYPAGNVNYSHNTITDGVGFGLELSSACAYYFSDYVYGEAMDEEEARYMATVRENNIPYEMPQYIGSYWTEDQKDIYSIYSNSATTFTRAQEAMFISGERDWDEFDDYIAELDRMGGDEMNQLYQEYMEMVVEFSGLVPPAEAAAS